MNAPDMCRAAQQRGLDVYEESSEPSWDWTLEGEVCKRDATVINAAIIISITVTKPIAVARARARARAIATRTIMMTICTIMFIR